MKLIVYFLIFLILLSCTPGKNNETGADSTQSTRDTIANVSASSSTIAPANYPPPPVTNFPSFSQEFISDNELENSITQALAEMLNQYDSGKYRMIKKEYSVYYKQPSDYDESTLDASETETKTWYFDINNKLKAYSREYTVKVGSSVYDPNSNSNIGERETTIYLFSTSPSEEATLAGIYNDKNTSYQEGFTSLERIIISKCPSCGISLSFASGAETDPTRKVEVLEQDYISGLSTTFFSEYNALLSWLYGAEVKKNDKDYTAKEEAAHDETPYFIDYTIDGSLYENLVKSANQ